MNDINASQGFIFQDAQVRGQIVRLEHTVQTILHQHPYPPMLRHLLAEALASCLLLIGSLKFEGNMSLQFQGDKRLSLLLVQCDHQNLTHYFAQSEQLATRIWLATDESRVAGMMLQLMPGTEKTTQDREVFWEYATHLGQTITDHELLNFDNETLLHRLYHETELMLFDSRSARFRCRCSREKMQQVITLLGEKDAKKLIEEKGHVEVSCDFCNNQYHFDSIDVTLLFHK